MFRGFFQNIGNMFGGGDGGTRSPQATGRDELFPGDCGRDNDDKGKLCFPDGLLCQQSKSFPNWSAVLCREGLSRVVSPNLI